MALGPEHNIAVIKAREEERRRWNESQRYEALSYVKAISRATEKVLDKSILNGDYHPYASEIEISRRYEFLPWRKNRVRFVFKYASDELQTLLEKKYLPLGWKKVRVSNESFGSVILDK